MAVRPVFASVSMVGLALAVLIGGTAGAESPQPKDFIVGGTAQIARTQALIERQRLQGTLQALEGRAILLRGARRQAEALRPFDESGRLRQRERELSGELIHNRLEQQEALAALGRTRPRYDTESLTAAGEHVLSAPPASTSTDVDLAEAREAARQFVAELLAAAAKRRQAENGF